MSARLFTRVRNDFKLQHQDSITGFRNTIKLFVKNPNETTVRKLTINYNSSEMAGKLFGNPVTSYFVHSEASSCSPDTRQKLAEVESQVIVMRIPQLRAEVHLPSDNHRRTGLAAEELLRSTSLKRWPLEHNAI